MGQISALTLKTYSFQFNMLLRYFGDIDFNSVTTDQLKTYLIEEGEHLKPLSLGHRVRFIRSLFKWAFDEGFIKNNPAAKLKEPKLEKRIPKFLTELEIEHLRESCENAMEIALFEFFYSTGCRIGEAVKLNRDDIFITRISDRTGIKKRIHPHQLRHSYATHMMNNGAPLEVIQSLLGHEKSETTKVYAQFSGKLRHDLYSKYF
ncbi:tyrosine-type recombinase/integrase [Fictibacillus sp. KU28468]|uniref:tyrosine-type recombinase/integrase n=1 Tax=Fictibacillus sp. KU28468 TaxID=2991053 RepID=UPI00223D13DA|nr:tyrosine-type recombinase/integrase [Fictibacillus sp. KU28468]UZJ80519.1 tyrosine-type recombinase/integrase [Fictibacillus sp. KU28468]